MTLKPLKWNLLQGVVALGTSPSSSNHVSRWRFKRLLLLNILVKDSLLGTGWTDQSSTHKHVFLCLTFYYLCRIWILNCLGGILNAVNVALNSKSYNNSLDGPFTSSSVKLISSKKKKKKVWNTGLFDYKPVCDAPSQTPLSPVMPILPPDNTRPLFSAL